MSLGLADLVLKIYISLLLKWVVVYNQDSVLKFYIYFILMMNTCLYIFVLGASLIIPYMVLFFLICGCSGHVIYEVTRIALVLCKHCNLLI
jgi:hypothetical protein